MFDFYPAYIMSLLLTVSKGYASVSDEETTNWAKQNLAKIEEFL